MKIDYISVSDIPSDSANSVHVMKMARELSRLSDDFRLFCKLHSLDSDAFEYYGVSNKFRLVNVFTLNFPIVSALLYAIILNLKRGLGVWSRLAYGRHLLSIVLANFIGGRVVYESHAMPSGKLAEFLERYLLGSGKCLFIVVISQSLKNDYVALMGEAAEAKILVLHDGADKLDIKNEFSKEGIEKLNVGYVGHLYEGRGVEVIVGCAKLRPNYNFYLLGGTPEDLDKWKRRVELPNLIFLGHKPHSEVDRYYKEFDVLLAPYQNKVSNRTGVSDTSRWMSPMKVFEYMAQGRPIICSKIEVLEEVLSDNENAILVNPDSVEAWVASIDRLNEDPVLREYLGGNARRDLEINYTWAARAEKVIENILSRI